ncbi:MAG: hypothetical protein WCW30_01575 [Candidatus Gracilibacteria bacterium]
MKRSTFLFGLSIVAFSLLLNGCFGEEQGPTLFDENNPIEGDESAVPVVDTTEFGYKAEGTQCVKQIHGGCVPYEGFNFYKGSLLGLHFLYPTNWAATESDDLHIKYLPAERTGDSDPTMLVMWRAYGLDEAYKAVNVTLAEEGVGKIGDYDVTFEIYEGTWNETPVKSEWIYLTMDKDNPAANFVFFLMTEPENFAIDQEVIQAAASSILME